MLPGAQGGWTAGLAALGDRGEDPGERPEGLDVRASAQQHRERVLLGGSRVRQGGTRARRPRVPRRVRVQRNRRRGGEGGGGEDLVLLRVRQRPFQHQGHAHAHQPMVHLRRG